MNEIHKNKEKSRRKAVEDPENDRRQPVKYQIRKEDRSENKLTSDQLVNDQKKRIRN